MVAIFFSKIVWFLLHPLVGMFSCHLFPVFGNIFFHRFGMSCFVCFVLFFVDISLIFLLSPVNSGSFSLVVLLFFSRIAFSYLFQHIPASFFFVLSILLIFVYLLSA